jgi:hypothetical protein
MQNWILNLDGAISDQVLETKTNFKKEKSF